jgi:hypothetical protein
MVLAEVLHKAPAPRESTIASARDAKGITACEFADSPAAT